MILWYFISKFLFSYLIFEIWLNHFKTLILYDSYTFLSYLKYILIKKVLIKFFHIPLIIIIVKMFIIKFFPYFFNNYCCWISFYSIFNIFLIIFLLNYFLFFFHDFFWIGVFHLILFTGLFLSFINSLIDSLVVPTTNL